MVNKSFVLTTTKDKLVDLLWYTFDNSISMVIGGMIMLIYLGEQPIYNPGLMVFFIAISMILAFVTIIGDVFFRD